MREGELLVLKGQEIISLLQGREREIIENVRLAYEAHEKENDSLPHSLFLRFPHEQKNRIIALPAYLGEDFQVAGIKWIASFPSNHERGFDRASAVVILNSPHTGRPQGILEGSVISAKRTAASAALAAQRLLGDKKVVSVAVIGCGLINFETTRFLRTIFPEIKSLVLYDRHAGNAERFGQKCREELGEMEVETVEDINQALGSSNLISIATTAVEPHIDDLSQCAEGATILHISLRDLSPEAVLSGDNVVDDIDHVCRAQTSVHLAEQKIGHREFIRCTLGEILLGKAAGNTGGKGITIFSPFGLGILDLAVSKFVLELASHEGRGISVESFLPDNWLDR
jgi:ornithine cyclodeaminase